MFSAASNIIITDFVKFLFIFSVDWLAFGKEHGVWSYNTEFFWFSSDDLEFNWLEVSSDYEQVAFLYRSVGILEIWNQVCFSQVSSDTFNSILKRKDMDFGQVWNFAGRSDLNDIAQSDSQIFSDSLVHSDLSLFEFIIDESND